MDYTFGIENGLRVTSFPLFQYPLVIFFIAMGSIIHTLHHRMQLVSTISLLRRGSKKQPTRRQSNRYTVSAILIPHHTTYLQSHSMTKIGYRPARKNFLIPKTPSFTSRRHIYSRRMKQVTSQPTQSILLSLQPRTELQRAIYFARNLG